MSRIALIGGTGVYDPLILSNTTTEEISTPYGNVIYKKGYYHDKPVIFITRHGINHSVPPHLINYRANIYALKMLGITGVLATTAVGSLNKKYKPGEFVLINQFLDFTKNRKQTFYDGTSRGVAHVDMTEPYCQILRELVLQSAVELKMPVYSNGTYVCTEGPRFETPAEINMFKMIGGDVVGMTNVPEAQLAREAEICYATVSMVTNFAAGISSTVLTHSEVVETMDQNAENIKSLMMAVVEKYTSKMDCFCKTAMSEYGGFRLE